MFTRPDSIEASLSPPLSQKCAEIQLLLASATGDEARTRFLVGKKICEIKESEAKYGNRAVSRLAKALARDEATLYRYALVAERWSDRAFAALLARHSLRGEPLSWTHLVELASVDDDHERERIIEEALRDGLSVRALLAVIRGDAVDESADGRPVPLKRLTAHLEIARREAESVSALLARVDRQVPTHHTAAMLIEVEKVHGELTRQLGVWKERLDAMRAVPEPAAQPPATQPLASQPPATQKPPRKASSMPPRPAAPGTMPRVLSGAAR